MPAKRPFVSFREVKEKISIPDVLDVLGIAHQFTRKADHLAGCCPLPQHRHGPHPNPEQFKIDCKQGTWLYKCFGDCDGKPGGAGDVIEFVKAMTGLSDAHVRFWFADKFGPKLSIARPRDGTVRHEKRAARENHANNCSQAPRNVTSNLPDVPTPLKPLKFFLNLDPAVPYLRERGLSDDTIQRYSIGLCSRGVLKGYVAFPVYNWPRPEGELPVGYFGRWPGEDFDEAKERPRYKWPVEFPKEQVVYGLPEAMADSDPGTPLAVVSSPFSVFHCFQEGFPNVVALCNLSLSDPQATVLAQTGRPILLMLGSDEPSRQEIRQAAAKLIKHAFVRVAALPVGLSPQMLTHEQLAGWLA